MAILVNRILENRRQEINNLPVAKLSRAQKVIKAVGQSYKIYKHVSTGLSDCGVVELKDTSGKVIAVEGPCLVGHLEKID